MNSHGPWVKVGFCIKQYQDWLCNPAIEQDFLETVMQDGEESQQEEKLNKSRLIPTQGYDIKAEKMVEVNLLEDMVKQQLSNMVVEFEPALEWQVNVIKDEVKIEDKNEEEEMQQQNRLLKRSHPVDQLDKDIEEIRKMMFKLVQETANNGERWNRRDLATEGKQQQQQQGIGGNGKLQIQVWDPRGSQLQW
jgi:hypothetical protein